MLSEARREKLLNELLKLLYAERGQEVPPLDAERKADRFRALCNVRPPYPVSKEFLRLQDEYLSALTEERGVVQTCGLSYRTGIAVWQGDITRLAADAIVNAGNSRLLGCFQPLHNCVDNVIHSFAGVQVRLECEHIMRGKTEPNGGVRVTGAYNLPSRYIFHTVGPQVAGDVTRKDSEQLAACYRSCLNCAREMELHDIAFCCISTGVFGYPNGEACRVATDTVKSWLGETKYPIKVIFNTYLEKDTLLYQKQI